MTDPLDDYYGQAIYQRFYPEMGGWHCNICGHYIDNGSMYVQVGPMPDRCPNCEVPAGALVNKDLVLRNIKRGLDYNGHDHAYHQWFGGRC